MQSYFDEHCTDIHRCQVDVSEIMKKAITSTSSLSKECQQSDSIFFIQLPCVVHEDAKIDRQVEGLFIGCMGVFIALFFVVFIDFLRSIFKNQYIEWDVKTITAGDYSVELQITDTMWKNFLSVAFKKTDSKTKLH